MKSFELSFNSWHMKFANYGVSRYDRIEEGDKIDFCSYARRVMWGFIKKTSVYGGIAIGAVWVLFSIANTIATLFYGYPFTFAAFVFWGVIGTLALITIMFFAQTSWDKYKEKRRNERRKLGKIVKHPSFFDLAYRKLKDKTCFTVEIK